MISQSNIVGGIITFNGIQFIELGMGVVQNVLKVMLNSHMILSFLYKLFDEMW